MLSLDGMVVWAFGDGDYGKLGTGSSTAKYYPQVSGLKIRNPLKDQKRGHYSVYLVGSIENGMRKYQSHDFHFLNC